MAHRKPDRLEFGRRWLVAAALLTALTGCGEPAVDEAATPTVDSRVAASEPATDPFPESGAPSGDEGPDSVPSLMTVLDSLPEDVQQALAPWTGDLPGMAERRVVRLLTVYEPMFFGFDGRKQYGMVAEAGRELEDYLNDRFDGNRLKISVVIQPVARDLLIPFLAAGRGDIAAAGLTITPERLEQVDFTRPFVTDVSEIVVTGPGYEGEVPATLEDLGTLELYVRPSSSYWESLQALDRRLRDGGRTPLELHPVDEVLDAEHLLELVNSGNLPATVVDEYQGEFWAQIYPNLELHPGLAVRTGGEIAWAIRKDSPELKEALDGFVRQHREGTLTGNILMRRYAQDTTRVQRVRRAEDGTELARLRGIFETHASAYDLDWLLLVAQAFQESRLGADTENQHGAVGIMQIKPESAAEAGVTDVSTDSGNIEGGAAYLRLLMDRYLNDGSFTPTEHQIFAMAAYNAGPTRIRRLREKAESAGYDPDLWFDHVEVVVAREVGLEPVHYVSNIMKYYVTFTLMVEDAAIKESRTR
jgi:membrane-bound lytic murein transglycosylase MltF